MTLLIACVVITASIILYYQQRYQQTLAQSYQNSARDAFMQLSYSEHEYQQLQGQFESIMAFLRNGQWVRDFIASPNTQAHQQLEQMLISTAESQQWLNSLAFIDKEGIEQIHIDYDFSTGQATDRHTFTDHSRAGFFRYGQSVADNTLGAWGIELDYSAPSLLHDFTPLIRLLTPVVIDGVREGYIVINIDASILVYRLSYAPEKNLVPALVADNGYLINGISPQRLRSPENVQQDFNFAEKFPRTWQTMQQQHTSYVEEDGYMLVFQSITLFSEQEMQLVICLTPDVLAENAERDLNDLVKEGFFVFMIMLVFALPTISMFLHYHHRNIESKLARAALNGMSAVMISDKDHHVIQTNREFELMVGLNSQEIHGRNALKSFLSHNGMEFVLNVLEQLVADHVWEGEVELITQESNLITAIMRIQAIFERGKISYYITSLVDISQRKALENKLRDLSEKDALSQLWNRRKFELELDKQTQMIERYPDHYPVCLALFDIDYFKRVNDEQGHDQGDRVIIQVAQTLLQQLRTTDFLARVGGEEFAVIMPHTPISEALKVVERLRVAIELDQCIGVTISAGISDLSQDRTRSYKCADIVLYESKTLGRNQVSVCLTTDDVA